MINEFSRTEMLLGGDGMGRLRDSAVVVFGIGGVGSHAAEALARCGVGCLVLVDNDVVSLTNINRQSIALHSTIGRPKTLVMKEKIADMCPDTLVITSEQFVLPHNLDALFESIMEQLPPSKSIACILDAIDTVTAKLALASYAREHGIPIIASMGTGNKLHPELFRISDISATSVCPLCRIMRKELKARDIRNLKVCWSPEQPLTPGPSGEDTGSRRATPGSISFVPPVAGLLMAGEIVRDICGIS
ncbi:tRNA threonylcarbamoyladenosine dehydratase [Clostridiales bacterium TF09-2AC]|nr:tRNA threonylcarbamoyladenosine dehydratase [Clostridiales bacterium TF09-2AC]